MTAEINAPCLGSGGVVYTYEGPQFGSQLIEDPCESCGAWHDRHKPKRPHRRPSWWTRLTRATSPEETP